MACQLYLGTKTSIAFQKSVKILNTLQSFIKISKISDELKLIE